MTEEMVDNMPSGILEEVIFPQPENHPSTRPAESELREARKLLAELECSREFLLYIDPESHYGKRVAAFLARTKEGDPLPAPPEKEAQ